MIDALSILDPFLNHPNEAVRVAANVLLCEYSMDHVEQRTISTPLRGLERSLRRAAAEKVRVH